jgi:5-methylcytosine-specific restriction protein A
MSADDLNSENGRCSLCEREVPRGMITLHHLKPREKGGRAEHRMPLCRPCHKQLHAVFSNKHLAREMDSLERLRGAPQLQPFLQKPDRRFRTVMSDAHPRRKRTPARVRARRKLHSEGSVLGRSAAGRRGRKIRA